MAVDHNFVRVFISLLASLALLANATPDFQKAREIAHGKEIVSTSTCGDIKPERYCSVLDGENLFCDVCTGEDRIENVLKKNSSLYWISQVQPHDEVNITIHLNKLFYINKIIVKTAFTPLPSEWAIERSKDNGESYDIVQYLASDIEQSSILSDIHNSLSEKIKISLNNVLADHLRLRFVSLPKLKNFKELQQYTQFYALENISVKGMEHTKEVKEHRRLRRQDCFCSSIGTAGGICNYPGRSCPCKRGYGGRRCDKCAKGLYSFPNCKPCYCSKDGSITSWCKRSTGQCRCKSFIEGRTCNTCLKGYSGFPDCTWCSCHVKNTIGQGCDKSKKCLCKTNYAGQSCGECKLGYTGYPVCKKLECFCPSPGAVSTTCNTRRQCTCKRGYRGPKCDKCTEGFYGFPNCQECACHSKGALFPQCDSNSGKCVCYPNIGGRKCDKCVRGYFGFPRCRSCTCNPYGSLSNPLAGNRKCVSDKDEFKCKCKKNVDGPTCDKCKDLHYLFSPTNPQGCKKCGCLKAGTLGGLESCDQKSGQCSCKPFVEAGKCYECRRGYHTLKESDLFGCNACKCNPGGARYANCDKRDGKCKCRKHIGGFLCDRITRSSVYIPSLHHISAEVEEARTIDGKELKVEFNNSVFPGFSWTGYVAFSAEQNNVVVTIDIPRRSVYRILYRCIFEPVGYPNTASPSFTISPGEGVPGFTRAISAIVRSTRNGRRERSALLALSQGNEAEEFLMFKGKWTVTIFSDHKYLLLDYLVFMPQEYYAGTILQTERVEPCVVNGPKNVICNQYSYPDENHKSVVKFEAENGFFSPKAWSKENKKTVKYYRDNRVLKQLGANGMVHLNKEQNRFTVEMTIPDAGYYVFMVHYFCPGFTQEKIDMYVGRERGSVHILPCIYQFGCRQVVMKDVNVVKMFDLSKGVVTINLFTSKDADIAVDYIKAIPHRLWQATYITPAFMCRSLNGKCIPSAYEDIGISQRLPPTSTSSRRGVKVVMFRRFFNTRQDKFVIILQYQQTKHVVVEAELLVQTYNKITQGKVHLKYCPNKEFCRIVVQPNSNANGFTIRQGTTLIQLQYSSLKQVKISWLYLMEEKSYSDNVLYFVPIDNSKQFIEKCGRDNLAIAKTDKGYCMRSSFALTTHFNNGALSCRCSYYGSKSRFCDKTYGQCPCRRPNIIGRQCTECASGYYGFPFCRRCSCDPRGSKTGTCDYLGRCKCKANFSGISCHRCKAGYYGFPNCRACSCDIHGSLSTFCTVSGQCQCRRSFDGKQCDKCRIGFFGFPECKECNCDASGIKPVEGLPSGCNSTNAECTCKDNVIGSQCDTCKDYNYNLQFSNPKGCQTCSCSALGTNSQLRNCDKETGQCPCKPHATGQNCAICKDGFTALERDSMFGCEGCECDYAGSWDNTCNKVTGICSCKRNVGGEKCTSVKSSSFYIRNIHHLSAEFEDGTMPKGKPVTMGYSEKEFQGFSGRGYVPVTTRSGQQNIIDVIIAIPRPSKYRMLIRYVLNSPREVYCQVTISPTLQSDPLPQGYESVQIVTTQFTPTVTTKGRLFVQYLTVKKNGKEAEFFLTRGKWRVTLFVSQSTLLLDNLVMIPEDYYKATNLRQRVQKPCMADTGLQQFCVDYEYLAITEGPDTRNVAANTGMFVGKMTKIPYEPLNCVVLNDNNQLFLLVTVEKHGEYVIVMHYYKVDSTPSDVLISMQSGFGHENTARIPTFECKYSFGCRQIAIDDENKVKSFTLFVNLRNMLTVSAERNIAVISVSAIRYELWNMNYLIPQERCVKDNGTCVQTTYNIPRDSAKVEAEKRRERAMRPSIAMDKSVRTTFLAGDGTPVRIEGGIESNRYKIFVHYYQPSFGSFTGRIIVESGRATALSLPFQFCPNVGGCRALARDKTTGQSRSLFMYKKFAITISIPSPNEILIDYILLVPIRQFKPFMEYPEPISLAPKFLKECSEHDFMIDKASSKFCKNAMFTITTHFNEGVASCACDPRGSLSTSCEEFGGDCRCKSYVVGRRCNQCTGGYTGFPNCRRI